VEGYSRREFGRSLVGLPTYALLHLLLSHRLFAAPVAPAAGRWLRDLLEAGHDLRGGRLPAVDWQSRVESLFGGVDLGELCRLIDFDALRRRMALPPDRAAAQAAHLPAVEGLPPPGSFATKVFGLQRGAAIVPHGHRNMVSLHLVLSGEVRLRHFDRVGDEPGHILLRPTIDRAARAGDRSSISSQRDNVHWFVALGAAAYTFDVILDSLDPALGYAYRMDYVDPAGAEGAGGGLLRAPRLSFEDAISRYGRARDDLPEGQKRAVTPARNAGRSPPRRTVASRRRPPATIAPPTAQPSRAGAPPNVARSTSSRPS
jgi:hypothetical protein